ncbi:MAG: EamA family transporter [Candidatus Abyssubacteria bacterium]
MTYQGFLFAMLTIVLWGSASVLDKLALARLQPLAGVAARSIAISCVAVLAVAVSLRERAWEGVDARSWVFIILSGMCSGLLGQWTYYKALKYAEASRVVPIVGGFPLAAFFLAVLVLGESFTLQKLLGTALVAAGIMLLR